MSTTPYQRTGRAADALRQVRITRGYTIHAEGSVLIEFGNTRVLCTASVEEKVPGHKKGSGEGWVTAEYGMLPRATHTRSDREAARGKQSGRTQEIQRLIGRSLRAVFDLKLLGERTIQIDCDVIQADGGTRTAAITGAWVALVLALRRNGLEPAVVRQVAAVSVGLVDLGPGGRAGMVLDLEYEEDHRAAVDCNVVATRPTREPGAGLDLVEFQATGEGRSYSRAEALDLMDLGLDGCRALMAAQMAALA